MQRIANADRNQRAGHSGWASYAGVVAAMFWIVAAGNAVQAQFRDVTPGSDSDTAVQGAIREKEQGFVSASNDPDVMLEPVAREITQPTDANEFASESSGEDESAPIPEPIPENSEDKTLNESEPAPAATHDTEYEIVPDDAETVELIDDTAIRSLKFRGVMVGDSSETELKELWGEPFKTVSGATSKTLKYRVEPFRQVDVALFDGKISSILIHLEDPLEPAHCAGELRMTKIDPVPVPDEDGRVIGMVFPERGVMLSFECATPSTLFPRYSWNL